MISNRRTTTDGVTDKEKQLMKDGLADMVEIAKPVLSGSTAFIILAAHVIALCVPVWVPISTALYIGAVLISACFLVLYKWQADAAASHWTNFQVAAAAGKLVVRQFLEVLEKEGYLDEEIEGTKDENTCLTPNKEGTDKVQETE